MKKLQAHIGSLEQAIRALDSAFARANAAEVLRPLQPVSNRWQMSPLERAQAERAEIAHYDITPDHWGARLAPRRQAAFARPHGWRWKPPRCSTRPVCCQWWHPLPSPPASAPLPANDSELLSIQ